MSAAQLGNYTWQRAVLDAFYLLFIKAGATMQRAPPCNVEKLYYMC